MYCIRVAPEDQESLEVRLLADKQADGSTTFTPLVVVSLLLFVLIYFPCVATIAAIKEESALGNGVLLVLFTQLY